MLGYLRTLSQEPMALEVIKPGDPAEAHFLSLLVEDKQQSMGYADFVAYVHKEIQK